MATTKNNRTNTRPNARTGTKGVPRAQREQLILDAAAHEFAHHGYATTSVAAIAQRSGISKPLVYAYFDSKEGLSQACLHRAGQPLLKAVTDAQLPAPAHIRAAATLQAIFTTLQPRPHDWSVLYDPTLPPGAPTTTAHHYRHRLNTLGATGISQILDHHGDHDPHDHDHDLLTQVWFSTVTTAVTWWLAHPEHSAQDMTLRCQRLLNALLTHPTPEQEPASSPDLQ